MSHCIPDVSCGNASKGVTPQIGMNRGEVPPRLSMLKTGVLNILGSAAFLGLLGGILFGCAGRWDLRNVSHPLNQ